MLKMKIEFEKTSEKFLYENHAFSSFSLIDWSSVEPFVFLRKICLCDFRKGLKDGREGRRNNQ